MESELVRLFVPFSSVREATFAVARERRMESARSVRFADVGRLSVGGELLQTFKQSANESQTEPGGEREWIACALVAAVINIMKLYYV